MKPLNAAQLRRQYELEFSPRYAWYRNARAAAIFALLALLTVGFWWALINMACVLAR